MREATEGEFTLKGKMEARLGALRQRTGVGGACRISEEKRRVAGDTILLTIDPQIQSGSHDHCEQADTEDSG